MGSLSSEIDYVDDLAQNYQSLREANQNHLNFQSIAISCNIIASFARRVSDFKGLILHKPQVTTLYLMTGFDGSRCILYGGKAPFFVPK